MPVCVSLLLCLAASVAADDDPRDWTYWRGPESNGISRETGLIDDWDPKGGPNSNVAWSRDDLGGRSTPIVMNGKLYTVVRADPGTPREGEKVVCVDAATGVTIWENRFNVWLSDVPDTRVGWSSCVGDPETGNVYALGVCGLFQCIDGETGERIWGMPLHEQFGLLSTYGGRTNFPVICEDLVIISAIVIGWGDMAKPAHRFLAFDKLTGDVVWFRGTTPLPYDTTYSSPTITVLQGQ
jgi:outer membrane protein assembly factor BamB